MWWIWVLIVGLVLSYDAIIYVSYVVRAKANGAKELPPVQISFPFGIPITYKMLRSTLNNNTLEEVTRNFTLVAPTHLKESMGRFYVVTKEPDNIKAVLATSFKDYSLGDRHHQLGAFLGDGIFTLSGEGWKHSRSMLRPQFSREQIGHIDSLKEHGDNLVVRLTRAYEAGEYVDIQALFHMLTMDTATEFLFGDSVESLLDSTRLVNGVSATQFVKDYNVGLYWSLYRLVAGPMYWLIKPKPFREAVARSQKFVDYFVNRALEATGRGADEKDDKSETAGNGYTFSYELAKVTRDPIVIRDQAFNILLAGRDTTASLMSYCIWYLAKNPEVWQKLREAVFENFGTTTTDVTFETLKRCTYLMWIINEVLRLNPVVPQNFRTAIRDTWLPCGGGKDGAEPVFVPKGMPVYYSVYTLHRDKDHWGPDADEFRPERWGQDTSHGWHYLPFNGGPRICLGQQFALTEASFTLVLLAQKFDKIDLRDPNQTPVNFVRLTSSVNNGVWVKMRPTAA